MCELYFQLLSQLASGKTLASGRGGGKNRTVLRGGSGFIEAARAAATRLSSRGAQPGAASGDSPGPILAPRTWKALIDIAAPRRA